MNNRSTHPPTKELIEADKKERELLLPLDWLYSNSLDAANIAIQEDLRHRQRFVAAFAAQNVEVTSRYPSSPVVAGLAVELAPQQLPYQVRLYHAKQPPASAEYLLFFLPKKTREPLLGDLEEQYQEVHARFGESNARFWYRCQVILALWPLITAALRKLSIWGALGWLGYLVRRFIH